MTIADNLLFRRQVDAMRLFGFEGRGYRFGVWTIPDGNGDVLWFPRLYRHGMWHNELVDGGRTIYQHAMDDNGREAIMQQRENIAQAPNRRFIVFAKGRDPLGTNLLRYVGAFMPDLGASTDDRIKFNLVQDEIALPNPVAGV